MTLLRGNGMLTGVIGFALGCAATSVLVQGQGVQAGLKGKFAHVGIVVRDINKSAKVFADIFGVPAPGPAHLTKYIPFPTEGPYADKNRTMAVKSLQIPVNGMNIELLEPASPGPNPWSDFLDKHGEGVQHIAYNEVDGIDGYRKYLVSKGGIWNQGSAGVGFEYIDMTKPLGITLEILDKGGIHLPPQK